jgi:hypothetical protein
MKMHYYIHIISLKNIMKKVSQKNIIIEILNLNLQEMAMDRE